KGAPARPLAELVDPAIPVLATRTVDVRWDPERRVARNDSVYFESDTLFAVGRYSFVDDHVLNGFPYFYSIVPISFVPAESPEGDILLMGNPSATNAK